MGLVITLKEQDFVNIDGPCTVTFIEHYDKKRIRLMFEAERSTKIQRSNCNNLPEPLEPIIKKRGTVKD